MNGVDLVILVTVAASAAHGFFRGAAVQLLSFGGFWGGLILGAVLAPTVTRHVNGDISKTTTAVVVVFGLAILLGGLGERLGARVRQGLRVMLLGPVDSGLGAAIGVVATLLAIWLIAAMLSIVTVPHRLQEGGNLTWDSGSARPHRLSLFFVRNDNLFPTYSSRSWSSPSLGP